MCNQRVWRFSYEDMTLSRIKLFVEHPFRSFPSVLLFALISFLQKKNTVKTDIYLIFNGCYIEFITCALFWQMFFRPKVFYV